MEIVPGIREWLLEPDEPSVRWRTLTCLLERGADDPEVVQARAAIPDSKPVSRFWRRATGCTWLQRNPRTREMMGGGVEYGALRTLTSVWPTWRSGPGPPTPAGPKAAERYLALHALMGDWYCTCLPSGV
jgi:hypothetical protein